MLDGSVVAVPEVGSSTCRRRYTYEPHGEQTSPNPAAVDAGGDPADRNPFRFASGYYDTETGMLKYGTRYYMPDQMRWTQPDPKMGQPNDPMTLNPYTYAGCNPINADDPTGRYSIPCVLATAGLFGLAAVDALGFVALLTATPVGVASFFAAMAATVLIGGFLQQVREGEC